MNSSDKWLFFGTRGGGNRIKIIKALKNRPYNANQLAKELNVSYKTIPHHINILIENGLVTSSKERYGKVYDLSQKMLNQYDEFEKILNGS